MFGAIDLTRLETALTQPAGWLELALVLALVSLAWLFDRRMERRARAHERNLPMRFRTGLGRVLFPLTAILLLLLAHSAYTRYVAPPFFMTLAIPLLVALAVIRMLVYLMRRLFAHQAWLKTSERAIAFSMWLLVILYFIGVLHELAAEIDTIMLPVGARSVSLLTLFKGIAVVVVTLFATLWLSGLFERRIAAATAIDTNIRALLAKVLRAALLVVGTLIALQSVGFDLTLLAVFGGALGVGIGLGLQKLAANYIAGFTILLDKSFRLGDTITVDGKHGEVARVTSRYVVVRSGDGVEAIVPNETLVTTTVLNHTHTRSETKVSVLIAVEYGTDVDRALELLLQAASTQPGLMGPPKGPTAHIVAFGDNGIGLELGAWVRSDGEGLSALRSAISRRILELFTANAIAIPYPRRDVRIVAGAIPSDPLTPGPPETPPLPDTPHPPDTPPWPDTPPRPTPRHP